MIEEARRLVVDATARLASKTPGRTGNVSVHKDERIAITPTGVPYEGLDAQEVAVVDRSGSHLDGPDPSTETPLHLAVYRDLEPGAIVHTHSPWSTVLACLRQPLPPVHYVLATAGGTIPVAEYATYGTEKLANNVVETLLEAGTSACLLANHGLLAIGADLDDAFDTVEHVEFTAAVYCRAAAMGEPVKLHEDQIDRVADRLEGYGSSISSQ